uniref:Ovule protein n=1 Tax=Hymenolepis diminuta TaxID=6216 RepID=A0A0R3SNM6_HYMDI
LLKLSEARPLFPDNPIPGVVAVLTKKRKLFPEFFPTSPSSFALPRLMMPINYKHTRRPKCARNCSRLGRLLQT